MSINNPISTRAIYSSEIYVICCIVQSFVFKQVFKGTSLDLGQNLMKTSELVTLFTAASSEYMFLPYSSHLQSFEIWILYEKALFLRLLKWCKNNFFFYLYFLYVIILFDLFLFLFYLFSKFMLYSFYLYYYSIYFFIILYERNSLNVYCKKQCLCFSTSTYLL